MNESKSESILKKALKTTLTALFCIVVLIGIAEYLFFRFSVDPSHVSVELTPQGTSVFISPKEKKAQFVLPGSACWLNTGIEIAANETMKFQISGCVHLAVNRLVEDSRDDNVPEYSWVEYVGSPVKNINPSDHLRNKLLVKENADYGIVLGCLHVGGESEPNCRNNQRPKDIFVIKDGAISNNRNKKATLWLIVNDLLINSNPETFEEAKEAYIRPKEEGEDSAKYEEQWNRIVEEEYWDIWYDDNIGQYLIQITIKKEEEE